MLRQRYYQELGVVLEEIERTQGEAIDRAAEAIVESVTNDGVWHLYDTGHMLMYESVGRAGGLMMPAPLFIEANVTHKVRPRHRTPNPNRIFLDQIRDMPEYALTQADIQAGDVILVGSVTGVSVLAVEIAQKAKDMGLTVIALTSKKASNGVELVHAGGRRLYQVADIVLDTCVPVGDALVEVEALGDVKICPSSGIAASYMMWSLQATVVEKLLERGLTPGIYVSNHLPRAGERNARSQAKFSREGF